MLRRVLASIRGRVAAAPLDLPVLAWLLALGLAAASVLAKWLAVIAAYRDAPLGERLSVLARVSYGDLQLGAAFLVLALLSRSLPTARPWLRAAVFGGLQLVAALLLLAMFANVEFFSSWGTPLSLELVGLAPHLSTYILGTGISNNAGAMTAFPFVGLTVVVGAALAASAVARRIVGSGGRWRVHAWVPAAVLAALALGSASLERHGFQDDLLARLHPLGILSDVAGPGLPPAPAPSADDERRIADLLASPSGSGPAEALAALRGRRPNILVWSLESVGATYLRRANPYGRANTPVLDAAIERGSLVFDWAYCESPLSAQTIWALVTGISPPAKPFPFVFGEMPKHGPTLVGELSRAGYRTAAFSSSYHNMWNTRGILNIEPFDLFVDASDFSASGRYAHNGTGVEDRAMVDRMQEWLDEPHAPGRPFFALTWNVETHKPFTWNDMPLAMKYAPDEDRYVATIERADALLGRVLALLDERGLRDDTLIVVMGDHGEGLGRPPRPWDVSHSGQVFEDAVHVPFVLLHPALGRRRVGSLVTHADLMPTLVEAAGRAVPAGLDGRSLMEPLVERPLRMRSIIWWPLAMRAGPYKLLLTGPGAAPQLFDVVKDPRESVNLADRERDVTRAMQSNLLAWHTGRFRSDPSFGYRFPSLAQIIAGPMTGGAEWEAPSTARPTPSATPAPAQ